MREISFNNLKNFLNKNNSSKNNQLVRSSVSKIIDDIKKTEKLTGLNLKNWY